MSDHLTFQRTPSQFALLIAVPAEATACVDADSLPEEKMYMPCGGAFIAAGVDVGAFSVTPFSDRPPLVSVLPNVSVRLFPEKLVGAERIIVVSLTTAVT